MTSKPKPDPVALSETLNRQCFCVTLDRAALDSALAEASGEESLARGLAVSHPHLFSSVATFLPAAVLDQMRTIVAAIERVAMLPAYREAVLAHAPDIARKDHGPAGAFMGYDFHLAPAGPRLIEINTNAGGAFLNAILAKAQQRCCGAQSATIAGSTGFEAAVADMFESEWRSQRPSHALRRIAITDDRPPEQYLYPEFILAREMLRARGYDVVIFDAADFRYADGQLLAGELPVDLVYNRLTDFSLEEPAHRSLREAYAAGDVVLTPNPFNHAIFADKRNLIVLSDPVALARFGADAAARDVLSAAVPETVAVTAANAAALWAGRKELFFKPARGFGSRAAYRGDKMTRTVWEQIVADEGFIAQTFVPSSSRMLRVDGQTVARKVDVRLYTYRGAPLFVASRLYQGQTTNMRTSGGGFAPVLLLVEFGG